MTTKGWTYSINYGPDGEENWANLTTPTGEHVGNIRTHHAQAIVQGMNAALAAALGTQPVPVAVAVAWQWQATEDGEPKTAWRDMELGDLAGWQAIANRTPQKYTVEKRPLYLAPSTNGN